MDILVRLTQGRRAVHEKALFGAYKPNDGHYLFQLQGIRLGTRAFALSTAARSDRPSLTTLMGYVANELRELARFEPGLAPTDRLEAVDGDWRRLRVVRADGAQLLQFDAARFVYRFDDGKPAWVEPRRAPRAPPKVLDIHVVDEKL